MSVTDPSIGAEIVKNPPRRVQVAGKVYPVTAVPLREPAPPWWFELLALDKARSLVVALSLLWVGWLGGVLFGTDWTAIAQHPGADYWAVFNATTLYHPWAFARGFIVPVVASAVMFAVYAAQKRKAVR